jgi:hypothetical protein
VRLGCETGPLCGDGPMHGKQRPRVHAQRNCASVVDRFLNVQHVLDLSDLYKCILKCINGVYWFVRVCTGAKIQHWCQMWDIRTHLRPTLACTSHRITVPVGQQTTRVVCD